MHQARVLALDTGRREATPEHTNNVKAKARRENEGEGEGEGEGKVETAGTPTDPADNGAPFFGPQCADNVVRHFLF